MLRRILHIAIPNGMEDGIFQLVKVGLSSIVAMFGTLQIAANGVAQSIWSMAALAGITMSPVFITVIGQCMGEGDIENAKYFFQKAAQDHADFFLDLEPADSCWLPGFPRCIFSVS